MGKLQYLIIHTSDTPFNREVTADDITLWHLGAKNNGNGTYTFLGKIYNKQQLAKQVLTLPSGKKITADRTNGRGWSKTGYSDMIQRSGDIINLNPYDFNNVVEQWEMTNGAVGKNSVARHVVLVGGWSKEGVKNGINPVTKKYFKIEELYTREQIKALVEYVNMQLQNVPDLIVCGHNNVASKSCPNFKVSEFVKDYNIKCKTL